MNETNPAGPIVVSGGITNLFVLGSSVKIQPEISTLFVDALFALDEQGVLFPGATVPEDRLRMAGMEPIGYQRSRRSPPLSGTYRSLLPEELPKWRLKLMLQQHASER